MEGFGALLFRFILFLDDMKGQRVTGGLGLDRLYLTGTQQWIDGHGASQWNILLIDGQYGTDMEIPYT